MLQDLTSGSFELHVLGTFGERNLQQSWSPDYFNPFKEKYLAVHELDELAVITHTHTHTHTCTHTHTHTHTKANVHTIDSVPFTNIFELIN